MNRSNTTNTKGLFEPANSLREDETKKLVANYFLVFGKQSTRAMDAPNLLSSLDQYFEPIIKHPVAKSASELVRLTSKFIEQTDPDLEFVKMRASNIDDMTIINRLNKSGEDITKLINRNKHATPVEMKLLDDVLVLCMKLINDRIKNMDPRMRSIYIISRLIETNQHLSNANTIK